MLLGIPFIAFPREDMGNFGVCRGSHRAVAEAVEAHGGYDALVGDGDENGFEHAWWAWMVVG